MIEVAPSAYSRQFNNVTEAELYCRFLDINGQINWRLPTLEEVSVSKILQGWNQEHVVLRDRYGMHESSNMYIAVVPVRDVTSS
jgi:hypothetical protein